MKKKTNSRKAIYAKDGHYIASGKPDEFFIKSKNGKVEVRIVVGQEQIYVDTINSNKWLVIGETALIANEEKP